MSIKFPISPLQAARIDQQATVYKHGLKGATDPAPEGGGVIIEAATNKAVNGLQVPALTDEQLLAIYNATVAGKAVTITDATGMMHFSGVTADMVSDEVFVSFVYFDVMVLEYGEGDTTTFKAIGGKKLYRHKILVGNTSLDFVSTNPAPHSGESGYTLHYNDPYNPEIVSMIFIGFDDPTGIVGVAESSDCYGEDSGNDDGEYNYHADATGLLFYDGEFNYYHEFESDWALLRETITEI